MQVAIHLRRRSQAEPATAMLLLGQRTADLAGLLVHLACDPLPPIFATADGFLVSLSRPLTGTVGGVLRLRALAPNLFVPVDADLVPALLPAEAADLASRRGLVILPGGRALEFDPTRSLPLAEILSASELRRDAWQPLPEPAPLADRLTELTLEQPDIPLDDLPAPGDPIGTEDPRPQDVNPLSRALAKTAFGAGKTLAWLGQKLNLKGMWPAPA